MLYVKELLEGRDPEVFTIDECETAKEAAIRMVHNHVGALVVTNRNIPTGIVTERDMVRRVLAENRDENTTLVREIMSAPCHSCGPEDPIETARSLMIAYHIRHLPVTMGLDVVGVLSMRDVMEASLRESREDVAKLQTYIYGPACGG